MTTLLTFRDQLRLAVPPWLQRGNAERYLYALGVHIDAAADALVAGVKMRFPGVYSDESLPLIGRERRIRRGRVESAPTYAARLTRWLTDHRRRGGPYALLAQLWAYYAPANFPIVLQYRNGVRYTMDIGGAITRDINASFAPDAAPEQWARWWLFLQWAVVVPPTNTWDADTASWNDPTTVWDYALTPEFVEDVRAIPRDWNAAHCLGYVRFGGDTWNTPSPDAWDMDGSWDAQTMVELTV